MSSSGQLFGSDAQSHADSSYNNYQQELQQAAQNLGQATTAYQQQGQEAQADLASILPHQVAVAGPTINGHGSTDYVTVGPTGTDQGGSGYGLIASNALNQYNTASAALPGLEQQYEAATGLQGANAINPYNLTPAAQLALNTQTDTLNNSRQQQLSNIQAEYAARGITDPAAIAAAEALTNQAYAGSVAGLQSSFGQQQAATQATGAENLINTNTGLLESGATNAAGAIGGINTLAGESAGGLASTGGQYGNLSNSSANQSNVQQQQSNAATSSLLNVLAAGGGALTKTLTGGTSGSSGNDSTGSATSSTLGGMGTSTNPADQTYPTAAAPAAGASGSTTSRSASVPANTTLLTNPFTSAPYGVNAFNGGVGTAQNIFGSSGSSNGGQGSANGFYPAGGQNVA